MPGALAWRLVSNVRAGLVITGTELLSGLITDRNGPWLAQQLGERGVEVAHLICAGDRPADLAAALRFLADQGVDLIVTSGGLGPTADDLTAEVVAGFAAVALEIATGLGRAELVIDIRHRPGAGATRDALIEAIRTRHGRYLFSTDGTSLDEQVARLLRGRRIGLAESCTGGLLAARLTDLAGSSEYVAGGVVAYSNEAKIQLLEVPAELIEQYGAVSPQVARAMADGARQHFGAGIGVGITGVAGPGGGTAAKPVGYVCLCVTTSDGAALAGDPVLPGDRAEIRNRAVTGAMHLLQRLVSGA